MYKHQIITDGYNNQIEYIFVEFPNGSWQVFQNAEVNTTPVRMAYLEWLSEGNKPDKWIPE